MKAISRVLKPGGIALISTEWNLSRHPDPESFRIEDVETDLVQSSPLRPYEAIDWDLERQYRVSEGWQSIPPDIAKLFTLYERREISRERYEREMDAAGFRPMPHNIVVETNGVPLGSIFLTMVNAK